jgi:signal transduction histidine kinase
LTIPVAALVLLFGLGDRVAAQEGRLDIESPPGAGTKVTVQLPLGGVDG